jgi:hypothetical protein
VGRSGRAHSAERPYGARRLMSHRKRHRSGNPQALA